MTENYNDVTLNLERVATVCRFSHEMLEFAKDVEIQQIMDLGLGGAIVRLHKYVATSPEKILETKYPASVWQHFKQDYMPEKFKARFPVKYLTQKFAVKEAFPELTNFTKGARHLHVRLYT